MIEKLEEFLEFFFFSHEIDVILWLIAVEIAGFLFYSLNHRAHSSVVERSVHIGKVTGSIPVEPTNNKEHHAMFFI